MFASIAVSVSAVLIILMPADIIQADELKNFRELIFVPETLKPIDSELKIKVGDAAPDFILPSIQGERVSLSQFKGRKNVVLSFVPAAWTPVCSDQWPGYVFARQLFEVQDAIILGITVDNIPTLYAWTRQMGDVWFPVLSDFWPHGVVADSYGVLRSDGTTERALIIIDKEGIVRNIKVEDINVRPPLDFIVTSLSQLNKEKKRF
ncbi:MAG: redoxin domain-containing protein [Proteobacteria bacterium]|nr:redoxin domain-containing protein [Pseudomonadota bacterium]MBU1419295.1 redoxin domain-containing protein [Pseudomonadota bacterium]MBU1453238.1 redoxin domain-containing protein [Pseudomonadota bacterium]